MKNIASVKKYAIVSILLIVGANPSSYAASKSEFPNRPIRMVVVAGGGATDLLARLIGTQLSSTIGQQVVVDPRPGGSGVIAAQIVARAAPDGYTLLLTYHAHTINAARDVKLPFDPINDFTPITQLTSSGSLFTVNAASPPRSLREFIDWTKGYKDNLNVGVPGVGSGGFLAAALYVQMAGVRAEAINHAGSGPALVALVSKQCQYAITSVMSAMSFIRSGQLRPIAVTTRKRLQALPDVPAMDEALPGYEVAGWWGVMGPAKLPQSLVALLHDEIVKALQIPKIRDYIQADGAEVIGGSPEEFRQLLVKDLVKWPKLLKEAKVR